jgi:cell division protein FtsB
VERLCEEIAALRKERVELRAEIDRLESEAR